MNTARLNQLGFGLMAVGFLAGSFFLVQHPGKVVWPFYAVSFLVTAAGAVLLRIAESRSGGDAAKVTTDISTIRESLDTLLERVSVIAAGDLSGQRVFAVCRLIDDKCMEPINSFVEARDAITHRFGLPRYAEVMDSFARGERALNRAWCASADGYIDEVEICLARAETHLGKARATVEACFSKADATS